MPRSRFETSAYVHDHAQRENFHTRPNIVTIACHIVVVISIEIAIEVPCRELGRGRCEHSRGESAKCDSDEACGTHIGGRVCGLTGELKVKVRNVLSSEWMLRWVG